MEKKGYTLKVDHLIHFVLLLWCDWIRYESNFI